MDKPYKVCVCGNPMALHRKQCARCGLRFNTGNYFEPSGKNNPENTLLVTTFDLWKHSMKEEK